MSRPTRSNSSEGNGGERRRRPRLPVEGVSGGFLFSTDVRILNLSLDGVALETTDYLQIGRSYALKLRHADEELALRGRVIWCRMVGTTRSDKGDSAAVYNTGIRFENLMSGVAREVHRFLGANAVITLEKRLSGRFQLHEAEAAGIDRRASFQVARISLDGMEIDSDTHVEPEAVLDIEIRVGGETLRARGRVVHGHRLEPRPGAESASRLGIEFISMDDAAEQSIQGLIKNAIRQAPA